jgi:TonB family protein
MRHLLIASLLLSPALFTASAVASQPGTDAAASTDHRVSTGVTTPKVIHSASIEVLPSEMYIANETKVQLSFHVDEKGKASDIKVVNPSNPILDQHVVKAISKFRFEPATLDNQPVPIDMNWTVEVEK